MGFDFIDTPVYKLSKTYYKEIKALIKKRKPDRQLADQLRRAALSIVLNIAEGYGRFHKAEKRYHYVTARASINECYACLDLIFEPDVPSHLEEVSVELSKMLSGLIKKFKN